VRALRLSKTLPILVRSIGYSVIIQKRLIVMFIVFGCTRNMSMTLLFKSDFSLIVKTVGGKYLRCVFMGWIILIFRLNMNRMLQ